jgi:hypothetical protein
MNTNRLSCRLCSCLLFNYKTLDNKYKCNCKHNDVWHKQRYDFIDSSIALRYKIKTGCKKIIGSVFSNYNINLVCNRCLEPIQKCVVLNCKHHFCFRCSKEIVVVCPICIKYLTNKVKIIAI